MKKKKKSTVDIRLFLFRNVKKSFKYYFKNIFYILFINIFVFTIINTFIKVPFAFFVMRFFSNRLSFNIVYYGSFIILFLTIKIILYGNTIYVMKSKGSNDLSDLFLMVLKRFLPTLGTFIVYIILILFLSLFLLVPGVIFFFYYYFGVFLCAVGDTINKDQNEIKILNGARALGRSYQLVRHNLIRFIILTILMAFISYILQLAVINLIIQFGFVLNNFTYNIIRFCLLDLFIIYSALAFIKLEGIENDVIEEEYMKNQEEQALMNEMAINSHINSRKK